MKQLIDEIVNEANRIYDLSEKAGTNIEALEALEAEAEVTFNPLVKKLLEQFKKELGIDFYELLELIEMGAPLDSVAF